mmetsp:Transcript_26084/g.57279  ORF Transcript_26084/g.57279 Transcript_26084/m.57279 type:complete len:368 (+) Transcript_26084:673-1776(+)
MLKELKIEDDLATIRGNATRLKTSSKDEPCPVKGNITAGQRNAEKEFQPLLVSLMQLPTQERDNFMKLVRDSSCYFEATGELAISLSVWEKKSSSGNPPRRKVPRLSDLSNVGTGINGVHPFSIPSDDTDTGVVVAHKSASASVTTWLEQKRERTGEVAILLEQFLHQKLVDKGLLFQLFVVRKGDEWLRKPSCRSGVARVQSESGQFEDVVTDYGVYVPSVRSSTGKMCTMTWIGAIFSRDLWFYQNPKKADKAGVNVNRVFAAYGHSSDVFSMGGQHVDRYLLARHSEMIRRSEIFRRWKVAKHEDQETFEYRKCTRRADGRNDAQEITLYPKLHSDEFAISKLAQGGWYGVGSQGVGRFIAPLP